MLVVWFCGRGRDDVVGAGCRADDDERVLTHMHRQANWGNCG